MLNKIDNAVRGRIFITHKFSGCELSAVVDPSPMGSLYLCVEDGPRVFFIFERSGAAIGAAAWIEAHFPAEAHALAFSALSHFEDVFRILNLQGAE